MAISRALTAAVTVLAHITLLSASSVSAYYNYGHYSNPCHKEQCCWALNVNHWDIRNLCYGCEGQHVCAPEPIPTPRPTKMPTKKPTITWRNDGWNSGWNNNGYGDMWNSRAQNFCCQTAGLCPINTPFATHQQWLDAYGHNRVTTCCERDPRNWQSDNWRVGGHHGRSLQHHLPF